MRLFKCVVVLREPPLKPKFGAVFQSVILIISFFLVADSFATPDVRESHLLASRRSGEQKGKSQAQSSPRAARSHSLAERERTERVEKQVFRLELLRQIKAIDHMKCFPKVLCGLSVDSDKSFGINKSNFVRSYLELMRNIKRPGMPALGGGFAEERLRPEEEIEKELIWPFSPHNPDRKHHSSFERISSGAMSASVELADSPEYLSRGMDSRNMYGSSMSMEKIDRMGVVADSIESKEDEKSPSAATMSSGTLNRMENSKIPGEKKNKNNANKSITAKITSYFTSWLPELPTFTWGKSETGTGTENEKWNGRKMNDDLKPSPELLSNLEDIVHYLMTAPAPAKAAMPQEERKGRADEGSPDGSATRDDFDDGLVRDHDTDIYHTAVNIGKRLKDPKQCDYIYNGCPLEYDRILDMISSLKTEIQPLEDTAEIVSQELGLGIDIPMPSTTTTTTTTTKKPQRKKPRPSTKIMHVLPNGEKVEINFRLGGSEDSEESSSSAQREYIGKKENFEDEPSSERNKNSDEVVVVDLGQRGALTSTEEVISSERKTLVSRKGSPVDAAVVKNKLSSSAKKKFGFHPPKKTVSEDTHEKSDEYYTLERADPHETMTHQHQQQQHNNNLRQNPTLKLSGLTLTTNNNEEQPLEISPSYVIIKHQPLSVHTSVLSPEQSQQHSGLLPHEKLQTFQLIQNGQKLDADQITDQLKNYIRQSGGLIPKLSLHSSGLITTDTDSLPLTQTSYGSYSLDQQNIHPPNSNPYAGFKFEPTALASALNKLASSTQAPTQQPQQQQQPLSIAHLPYAAYYSLYNNGPEMVGSVPGRLDSLIKPKTTTTTTSTTTSTTSTTTEKIILPGMQETLTLDTDEITEDTMKKLESDNSVPGWISKTSDQTSAESSRESESEEDDEEKILENLNKTLMKENNKASKIKYKNPEKRRTRVKANSSRVRASLNRDKNKDSKRKGSSSTRYTSASEETSAERVVIKHAGPYVYKSPLKGPGPHGGAFPSAPYHGMHSSVFPGMPFWRM